MEMPMAVVTGSSGRIDPEAVPFFGGKGFGLVAPRRVEAARQRRANGG
jgi:hypothetical protein